MHFKLDHYLASQHDICYVPWEEEGTSSWGCSVASAVGVQSTPSMRSMLHLGGSGGMPPQENLQK